VWTHGVGEAGLLVRVLQLLLQGDPPSRDEACATTTKTGAALLLLSSSLCFYDTYREFKVNVVVASLLCFVYLPTGWQ